MLTLTAQQNAPFRYSQCPAPVVCCVVPAPMRTQPVPGGTPTMVPDSAVNLFGAHVSNLNKAAATMAAPISAPTGRMAPQPRATGTANLWLALTIGQRAAADGGRYLQFFDSTTEPAAGTVPIGSSSWWIAGGKDRDLDVGSGGGGSGWAFEKGIMACCSTDQGDFQPSSGCGFLLQYY